MPLYCGGQKIPQYFFCFKIREIQVKRLDSLQFSFCIDLHAKKMNTVAALITRCELLSVGNKSAKLFAGSPGEVNTAAYWRWWLTPIGCACGHILAATPFIEVGLAAPVFLLKEDGTSSNKVLYLTEVGTRI